MDQNSQPSSIQTSQQTQPNPINQPNLEPPQTKAWLVEGITTMSGGEGMLKFEDRILSFTTTDGSVAFSINESAIKSANFPSLGWLSLHTNDGKWYKISFFDSEQTDLQAITPGLSTAPLKAFSTEKESDTIAKYWATVLKPYVTVSTSKWKIIVFTVILLIGIAIISVYQAFPEISKMR